MIEHDPKPYANTDERQQGGFSNDDENIRQQQAEDVADENQDSQPLPDPGGERHATIDFDDEDFGEGRDEIASR
ncbi:hypothetical protein SAMN02745157_1882 [Kaistia soli DSM 19436]|uniref:Uncharacterized protein n=1 Tax=Kaistia soli DSM 19436 TaxID=1122133 RepID=A0A1M4ZPM6_9HYPH|nr:hypothetical protein [Kaistia soli]SHF19999.1 hypothetical protein SAMN02745157_1882 [Kaistia soli DSM 19436]